MRTRISMLILLVVICQLLTFTAVLVFSGEFSSLKEHSYNILVEKAKNGNTYVQNELQKKNTAVQNSADQLNSVVNEILKKNDLSIADLKKDKELTNNIIESSVDIVLGLVNRSTINDAYLILDTGDLYSKEGVENAKAGLYLQDADPDSGLKNGEVQIIFGSDSISQNFGFNHHVDWSQYVIVDPIDEANFDFYYTTLQTAHDNSDLTQKNLGYWSKFSEVSSSITPSMKYSVPLIAKDGTVYGVLGVGMTEGTIMSNIPSYDLLNDSSCYVLGYSNTGESFNIQASSGLAYDTLLGDVGNLRVVKQEGESIYRFDMATDINLVGSVQSMDIYNDNSPYASEQWVMISVADREGVLQPLLFLERMLMVSIVISLIVVAIVTYFGSDVIIKPLSNLSKLIKTKRKYNEVIRFQPSNIYEVDEITDAITQLQINVNDFSSQVSKMISIADVGLGTFMYDRTDNSVFVGQSLIKVLRLNLSQGEDIMMRWQDFLNSIRNTEIRSLIASGLDKADGGIHEDVSEVHEVKRLNGNTMWLRLSYTYSPNTVIGTVQDITDSMVEKIRIEHERDHDTLTDLLTRHAYYHHLEELFHNKKELKTTAIVMIDLDNLKYVNDTYGHAFGDSYIKTAARILNRFQDYGGIVSRLSGDEFNICLPGFSSKEEVWEIIQHIRNELLQATCLLADGNHFKISASMGVSWYPNDANSYELLMKYADFAMYTVKHSVKGGIAEFDIKSYSTDSAKLTDLEELNHIIEENKVQYAFQSIVSVKTGKIFGYEALMRVKSDIFQSPLELLNTAKTRGKLHEIERLTWTRSLADFQTLMDNGKIENNELLFVNSIANHKLEDEVITELENTYPHLLNRIVIEILESERADEDSITHKEQLVHRWGGQIALDDYGTGYNSEYALLSIHPNIIKIDRSIINGCDYDEDRRMVIENLVKLARANGVLVLAEGVETEGEMNTVIACGIDFLQGFYVAKPVFNPEPVDPQLADTIRHLATLADNTKDND